MPAKDSFDPAYPLPRFLAAQAVEDVADAPAEPAAPSRVLKAGLLIAAAAAISIAAMAVENPAVLLAEMSASLLGNSQPQPAPEVQSAEVQPSPPATTDTLTSDDTAASVPAVKDQAENGEKPSESLFRQFKAWAAEQDAQTDGGSVQTVQDARAQVEQNVAAAPATEPVQAPYRTVQKRRHGHSVHNARAELRTQNLRKQVRRTQSPRAERPPQQAERPVAQEARAPDAAVQNAQLPSFLSPIFGQRN